MPYCVIVNAGKTYDLGKSFDPVNESYVYSPLKNRVIEYDTESIDNNGMEPMLHVPRVDGMIYKKRVHLVKWK